jgi:hypothetical protein
LEQNADEHQDRHPRHIDRHANAKPDIHGGEQMLLLLLLGIQGGGPSLSLFFLFFFFCVFFFALNRARE